MLTANYNKNLVIEALMDKEGDKVSICKVVDFTLKPDENRFSCPPRTTGRYVKIRRRTSHNQKKYLILCEVEVYGTLLGKSMYLS